MTAGQDRALLKLVLQQLKPQLLKKGLLLNQAHA
jgi:hypothetical protein